MMYIILLFSKVIRIRTRNDSLYSNVPVKFKTVGTLKNALHVNAHQEVHWPGFRLNFNCLSVKQLVTTDCHVRVTPADDYICSVGVFIS